MPRVLNPELLERVRAILKERFLKDPREQQRYRDWQKIFGGDPNKPYEPDERLVRSHAARIAAEDERE